MRTTIGTVVWPWVGLMLLLPACGDDGGGGSEGGGDDDGTGGEGAEGSATAGEDGGGADDESGDEPPDPPPDENGDECGGNVVGWETRCMAEVVTATASDKGDIPGVPGVGAETGRALCCEGNPPIELADARCEDICQLELCEAAKLDHMKRCDSCGPFDCGFVMTKCLAGGAHEQLVTCRTPAQFPFSYTLTASCSAINNELRNPDGSFLFLQDPNEDFDDPAICRPSENLEHDPPRGLGQYKGSESEGTVARVTWSMADAGGEQQSEELDVLFQYAILPCAAPSSECMQLTALELTLPATEVLGMTLTRARLSVISVTEAPIIERGDRFHFSDGSIRVLMEAHVNGFPLVLSGWNVGMPQGRLSPGGDQFSLTDLRFEFEDSVVSAALELAIQGQYDARRPNAQITLTTAPTSCAEPVALLATSWDDDEGPLTHSWWIRGVGKLEGTLVEVVLPAGEHDVMLTSFDPSGLFDTETLRYARRCR
jgi:hypothetical protein